MNTEATINWRWRVGLILALSIGLAWGLIFGWFQIRTNASLSPWRVVFVGMPGAFFGSLIVGLVHKRMLLSWPSVVRLLIALFAVMLGMPFGWLWALFENGYDPIQLAHESSALFWKFEWLMVGIGLVAGVWHLWMVPFVRLFGRLASFILAGPIAIIGRLGQSFTGIFGAMSGATKNISGSIARTIRRVGTLPEQWRPPSVETNQSWRTRRTVVRRTRHVKPKSVPISRANGKSDEIARVTGVVEDRCPYCSDIVKRNDPRGIRMCEVCGAPHHADCWSITGKCQVPHLNT